MNMEKETVDLYESLYIISKCKICLVSGGLIKLFVLLITIWYRCFLLSCEIVISDIPVAILCMGFDNIFFMNSTAGATTAIYCTVSCTTDGF